MALLALACFAAPVRAATLTWWAAGSTGAAGGTGTWNTTDATWTESGTSWTAWNNSANDLAVFGGATAGTVTLSTGITANGLTFDTTGYTITGNTITLGGTSPTVTVGTGVTGTLQSPLSGTAGTSFTKSGAGTLEIGGANNTLGVNLSDTWSIDGTLGVYDTTAHTLYGSTIILNNATLASLASGNPTFGAWYVGANKTITANGGSNFITGTNALGIQGGLTATLNTPLATDALTVSGQVINGQSGAGGLTKSGAGLVTLSGSNSYTGATIVSSGTLQIGAGGSTGGLSPSSAIGGAAGATLAFNRSDTITQGTDFNSVIGGSINVSQIGSGRLLLNGINAYAGTTTIASGTLELGGAGQLGSGTYAGAIANEGSFVVSTSANQTLWSLISGTGTLVKSGAGTLTLTGDNSYSGGTTVSSGTLILWGNNSGASRVGSGTLTIDTGATVLSQADNVLGWGTSAVTPSIAINGGVWDAQSYFATFSTATLNSGTLMRSGNAWYFNQPGQITSTGASSIAGGSVMLRPAGGATMPIQVDSGTLTISAVLANDSGAAGFDKTGAGTLLLTATNTYTGTTSISAGTLELGGSGQLGGGSYAVAIPNAGRFVVSTSADQTLSGTISGTGTLVKSGAGTLTLTANSSYSGGTTVDSGTLILGGVNGNFSRVGSGTLTINAGATVVSATDNVLGFNDSAITPAVVIDGGVWDAQTFAAGFRTATLNSGTLTRSSSFWYFNQPGQITSTGASLIAGGSVMLRPAGGATMPIQVDSGTLTISAVLANDLGPAGFEKTGAGVLMLSAVQAFTGAARVDAGTLAIGDANTLATASEIFVAAGATIDATAAGLAVASGQTLGGYGAVNGNVTIAGGAIVAPGGSIGTFTNAGTQTWEAAGRYLFEITDAGGTAGAGWDLLSVSALSLTATSGVGNQFVIDLQSLTNAGDEVAGPMAGGNWDPDLSYQWKFLEADTTSFSAANFDTSWFSVVTSPATFPNATNGSFYVARGGGDGGLGGATDSNELYLVYAAVPEPGTVMLAAVGLVAVGLAASRRRS